MDYARVLKIPQYFRNLQRLGDLVRVLIKHGFGDLVERLNLFSYVEASLRVLRPALIKERTSSLDLGMRLRLVCEELGPTFIKFAQLIAARPDIFPDNITREFRKLQDKVPPFPAEQARSIVEAELGRSIESIFAVFEPEPFAAASIAQVHKARLKDNQEVVVKVQRPHLQRIIDRDIDILKGLAELIEDKIPESRSFNPVKLVEEFSRSLRSECDFRREAASIRRFAENFTAEESLIVPRVFRQYSTARVITEEFIHGIRADDVEVIKSSGMDRHAIVQTLNRVVLTSIFEHRFFHADPHPGNILLTPQGKVVFVDFGAIGRLDQTRLHYVLKFLVAIFSHDENRIVDVLKETEVAPAGVDEIPLKTQIADLLDIYLELPLGKLDIARLLADVFEVARHYGVKPPADLLLVGKSIATIEHIGALLDPQFDPLQSVKPFLLKYYTTDLTNPQGYLLAVADLLDNYQRLFTELPNEIRLILRGLSRNQLAISTSSVDAAETRRHQNTLVNRSLLTATGLTFLILGVISLEAPASALSAGAAYVMLGLGAAILIWVWLAINRSGGSC